MKPEATRNERFLSRWSRLKREQAAIPAAAPAATATAAAPAAAPAETATDPVAPVPAIAATADAQQVPPLPAIESLTMDSDYSPFFQPKVPETLRRAALKKLFADPHFNVMDGLDTYIDDYTKADPLPEGWLEKLAHARDIIDHPSNRKVVEEGVVVSGDSSVESTTPSAAQEVCRPGGGRDPVDGSAPADDAIARDVLGPGFRRDDVLGDDIPVAGPALDPKTA